MFFIFCLQLDLLDTNEEVEVTLTVDDKDKPIDYAYTDDIFLSKNFMYFKIKLDEKKFENFQFLFQQYFIHFFLFMNLMSS